MIIEHLHGKITRILQFSSLASDTTLAKVQVQLPFRGWCEILGSVFLSTFWSHFVPIYYKIALRSSFTILKNRRFNLPYPFSYIEMWCYIYIYEIIFFKIISIRWFEDPILFSRIQYSSIIPIMITIMDTEYWIYDLYFILVQINLCAS